MEMESKGSGDNRRRIHEPEAHRANGSTCEERREHLADGETESFADAGDKSTD